MILHNGFIPKQKETAIEYGGYIIVTYIEDGDPIFKIVEPLPNGKFKTRRHTGANKYTGHHNSYGEQLSTAFESELQAQERAKNYIDKHIVKWADSPNNPINKQHS